MVLYIGKWNTQYQINKARIDFFLQINDNIDSDLVSLTITHPAQPLKSNNDDDGEHASNVFHAIEPEGDDHDLYHLQENEEHLQQEVRDEDFQGGDSCHYGPIPNSLQTICDDDGGRYRRPQKEHHPKDHFDLIKNVLRRSETEY